MPCVLCLLFCLLNSVGWCLWRISIPGCSVVLWCGCLPSSLRSWLFCWCPCGVVVVLFVCISVCFGLPSLKPPPASSTLSPPSPPPPPPSPFLPTSPCVTGNIQMSSSSPSSSSWRPIGECLCGNGDVGPTCDVRANALHRPA